MWVNLFVWIVVILITIRDVSGKQFFILGSRALSMGGAYISIEDNNTAFYWNPAKYSLNKTTSLELPIGVELIATHNIVKELDDVEQTFRENSTLPQFINEVNDLRKEKMGLVANAYGAISLMYNSYSLSFIEERQAGGNIYFKKIDEYFEEPYLQIKYVQIQEYILGMSSLLWDNLYLGTNIKVLVGKLDYATPHAYKEKDVEKKVKVTIKGKQANTTTKLGLDIGLIYNKNNNLRYGLVIRNLNSPKFSYPASSSLEDYQLKRQIRAGVSFKTNKSVVLALDCDVTKNDTLLKGYQSQNLSAGIEYPLYSTYLVLRGGYMKNLTENDIGSIYTLGFGLNFLQLEADIGGAISGKKTKRSKTGKEYPVNLAGSMQVSCSF